MKELVEYIVKSLTDSPDEVSVYEIQDRQGTVLELSVAAHDMGRVIGKSGRVINAIRSLLQVAAAKQGQRVTLELLEADDR
ncbi:MAG: KH domain-containing protein [Anaerolineales bacterium]|nr:KH domain-containing protein [Anaerolineales bacterium]MCA9926864.1 KH domain-containing protein [Anaerolineales bacterium]